MATAWQKKFGAASKACQVEVKKKIEAHQLGKKSLFRAVGDCVGKKLRGGGKKRRKGKKGKKKK